jgi:2'-5' RNA ligase
MNSETYILVQMIDKHEAGYRFARTRAAWPLHVTLVPWFVITGARTAELITLLEAFAHQCQPFTAKVGQETGLGSTQDIPVNLIADPAPFHALQEGLLAAVRVTYMSFTAPNVYIEENYKPHITHHAVGTEVRKVPEGTTVPVEDFTLVRLGPPGETQMCEIVRHFRLGAA